MPGAEDAWRMGVPTTRARSVKKGLAGIAPLNSKLVTDWYYDWQLHPATRGMPSVDPAILFYPMCWGWRPARLAGTARANSQKPASKPATDDSTPEGLMHLKAQNPKVLFGFNEPDHVDQSDLSVEDALKAWPAFQGVAQELVGPSCANPMGDWMAKFVPEIERQNLQMDALGFHSYVSPSVEPFVDKLEAFHARYKRPVWVTEFAVADWAAKDGKALNRYSVEQVAEFMQGACAYMDKTPWIRGYFGFDFNVAGDNHGNPGPPNHYFGPFFYHNLTGYTKNDYLTQVLNNESGAAHSPGRGQGPVHSLYGGVCSAPSPASEAAI